MITKLKETLLGKIIKVRLKIILQQDRTYDFAEELSKTEKVLIIMPAGKEYSEPMQGFIQQIGHVFTNSRVSTFVTSSLRKNDLSWLGVPNDHYLKGIRDELFDLVIDINLKQDKISSYLCALSGAPMRINLATGQYDHVYNLHFRMKDNNKTIEERLKNIISYLRFLIHQGESKS